LARARRGLEHRRHVTGTAGALAAVARAGDAEEQARRDAGAEARQFVGVTMSAELKTTLRLKWETWGSVRMDSKGKLRFPVFSWGPNLYRFSIEKANGSRVEYIGETDDLKRRFSHYRSPGPSQPTNRRMNSLCKEVLSEGGKIEIDLAEEAWIELNGVEKRANFHSKNMRRLFEYFALATGWSDEIGLLNK
jgi:hypothetical protein